MNKPDPHNIYFNISIGNNTSNSNVLANYYETRLTNVVYGELSDFECTVARMKIPSNSIPLFVWENNSFLVTLTDINGNDYPVYCNYVTNSSNTTINQNYVWEYTELSQSINQALNTAWSLIPALVQPSAPPFILFDPITSLYSLYATNEYNSTPNQIGKTQIWFNFNLNIKMGYFQVYLNPVQFGANPNKYANYLIIPQGSNQIRADLVTYNSVLNCAPAINAILYLKMTQQQLGLSLLSEFGNLSLRCNSLPVIPEQFSSFTSNSSAVFQQVLTTFEPVVDQQNGSYLQYQPAVFRWFTFSSNINLKTLDLYIFWTDTKGNSYPIYISYGKIATVLLYFKKKIQHVVITNE